jgi:mannose-6-phosphate isomerase-like protein (cupin superfamily)
MFRGFEKVDEGVGFLWTILGEDDPGKVLWAPAVFEAAADHGLRLTKGGRLIDTSSGDYELREVEVAGPPDPDSIRELRTPSMEELQSCVVTEDAARAHPGAGLTGDGVREVSLIASRSTRDGFGPGPIVGWWPQDFNLRRLTLATGAYIPLHVRQEAEVLLMHGGSVEVRWADGAVMLSAGDIFTVPIGLPHSFRNTSSALADIFVVRGTDDPAPANFLT